MEGAAEEFGEEFDEAIIAGPWLHEDIHSARAYVNDNFLHLEGYVIENYDGTSFEGHVEDLYKNAFLSKAVIENYTTPESVKFEMFIESLAQPKPSNRIVYIMGGIGEGKTTTAYDIANETRLASGRRVVIIGDPQAIPDWAELADGIGTAPPGSIVILDEAIVQAGARDAMSGEGRNRPGMLALIRQNDLILIVISQNSSLADKSFLALANVLVLKPLSLTQGSMERRIMGKVIRYWKELLPKKRGETFILAKGLRLKFERAEPDWYNDTLSKAYRRFTSYNQVMHAASRMRAAGSRLGSWKRISSAMEKRWEYRDPQWWTAKVLAWNNGVDPADSRAADNAAALTELTIREEIRT